MTYESEFWSRRQASARSESDGLPLFAPQVRPMARRSDPATSNEAALAIVDQLPRLQMAVFSAFAANGPMTAKQAERLPEFEAYGFSTVRKRISELAGRGWLRDTGQREAGCAVYEAVERASTTTTPRAA
jgi:hypothetical protein